MYVKIFNTGVTVFIGVFDATLTDNFQYQSQLHMRVTTWPNIFEVQFSDHDFVRGTKMSN
jgi:hypothetical protein